MAQIEGREGSCDLRVANLTLDLHWSGINTSPFEETVWVQTDWRPACLPTNHPDMQLPTAAELFLSCGWDGPSYSMAGIKKVSGLINLTDVSHCV